MRSPLCSRSCSRTRRDIGVAVLVAVGVVANVTRTDRVGTDDPAIAVVPSPNDAVLVLRTYRAVQPDYDTRINPEERLHARRCYCVFIARIARSAWPVGPFKLSLKCPSMSLAGFRMSPCAEGHLALPDVPRSTMNVPRRPLQDPECSSAMRDNLRHLVPPKLSECPSVSTVLVSQNKGSPQRDILTMFATRV